MATQQEIARLAGVSKSTVSRALRGDPTLAITGGTRDKIFQVAQQMGYRVKDSKLLNRSHSIAVIHKSTHFVNQIDNAYYFSIRHGIEEHCLASHIAYTFLPIEFIDRLPPDVDGVIITGTFTRAQQESIVDRVGHSKPYAYAGKVNFLPDKLDWITYDVGACVDMAMDELKKRGLREVLYVGGRDVDGIPEHFWKDYHLKRYLEREPAMECRDMLLGAHGAQSGYNMMSEWLEKNSSLPDAVFVSNDPIAMGVLRKLTENSINVPKTISVISINGDDPTENSAPPLTTVSVHTEEMGREAVRCLLEQMEGQRSRVKKVEYLPELILRSSVRAAGAEEWL